MEGELCGDDEYSKIASLIFCWYSGKQDIKLLFLDVDGVLNTTYDNGLRNDLINNLAKIVDSTGCKIVLSSSWRLIQKYKDHLFDALRKKGNIDIGNVYIGDTPLISAGVIRTFEIESSLNDIRVVHNITAWCAVDDIDLADPPLLLVNEERWYTQNKCKKIMQNHFVKTKENVGLNEFKMNQVIHILNGGTKL